MKLNDLTAQMTPGISDLHLIVGELPEHLQTRFVLDRHAVVSTVRHDLRRFRLSAFWEKGQPCATLRAIPGEVPRLTTLRIAPEPLEVLVKLTKYTRGLVIVTGSAGSGKTTLMVSLVEEINATRAERIYSIEESISYEFQNKQSVVTQQELGSDIQDYPQALRDLLWGDPDVVMLGTLNSLEAIALTLNLAEIGHLVFVQVNQSSATDALLRLVSAFPESNRAEVQRQLASNLVGVVATQIIPAIGGGRVPALEIVLAVPSVRAKLRQGDFDLTDGFTQTMAEALTKLAAAGTITEELAHARMPVSR